MRSPTSPTQPAGAFGRDVASLTAVRLGGVGAAFLASAVAARLLGPAELGIGGVALALATAAALVANGGVSMSTIYLLGRADDRDRVASGLAGLTLLTVAQATVGAALVVALFGAVSGWRDVGWIGAAAGLAGGAAIAAEIVGAQLLGVGRTGSYRFSEALRPAVTLVATIGLLVLSATATAYVLAVAVGFAAAAAVALRSSAEGGGWRRPTVDRAVWRDALGFGLRGQVGNVLGFLTLRLDLVIVGVLLGPTAAGLYFVAARVSEVVTQLANSTASLLFPIVAAADESSTAAFTALAVRRVTAAVAVSASILGVASIPLLPLVFGPEFGPALPSLGLLLVAAIPLAIARILAGDLKGRGRPGLVSAAASLGLAILVAGDFLLLPVLGIEGAAAVSILAYGANAVALAFAWRRATGAPVRDLLLAPADLRAIGRLRR